MNHSTTPRDISEEILHLCAELVDNPQPLFLNITPIQDGQVNDCFQVVEAQVRRHGGSVCIGWEIWEWPLVLIEAEFHAVWRDDHGTLHDLTPKLLPVQRILFLPDPSRIYQGRQIDNVRRPISPEFDVADFIKASEAVFEFMNRGSRAERHGKIVLEGADAEEYDRIMDRKSIAYQRILSRLGRTGRNDPCPCGSGDKYKKCHGRNV